jgi:hypothetical protein
MESKESNVLNPCSCINENEERQRAMDKIMKKCMRRCKKGGKRILVIIAVMLIMLFVITLLLTPEIVKTFWLGITGSLNIIPHNY